MTTREEWRRIILDDLGGQGVDAELDETMLDAALQRALECFNKYKPFTMWFPFSIGASQTTVITFFNEAPQTDQRQYPTSYISTIVDVEFKDRDTAIQGGRLGVVDTFNFYIGWGFQGPRTYFQLSMGERNYETMLGTAPHWHWDPTSRKLMITSPGRSVLAMVLGSRGRTLEELNYDHATDFRRLAVASAKRTLARVLGAVGPIPGPAGNIDTDAKELRKEAGLEWDAVEAQLKRAMISYPPLGYV